MPHYLVLKESFTNTSRFGSAIQALPSDIGEYFKLTFIAVAVVVFICTFHFFFLLYPEMT